MIWLGGVPNEHIQANIKRWKETNPGYAVKLWGEPGLLNSEQEESIQLFCEINKLQYCDINDLRNDENKPAFSWVDALNHVLEGSVSNYAAASDILRAIVLHYYGGLYTDTDTVYSKPLPLNMVLQYGFAFPIIDEGDSCRYTPSLIATIKASPLSQAMLDTANTFSSKSCLSEWTSSITSKDPFVRFLATQVSTGSLVIDALTLIKYHGEHILTKTGKPVHHDIISNCNIFNMPAFRGIKFFNEKTWLLATGSPELDAEGKDFVAILRTDEDILPPKSFEEKFNTMLESHFTTLSELIKWHDSDQRLSIPSTAEKPPVDLNIYRFLGGIIKTTSTEDSNEHTKDQQSRLAIIQQ
ncbi:MAG: TcdA/TcdB catalytic glycosyltransferase domain-containing protein [Coxiellaceae bacterium]|nr:TcdA/TcdB catalytic glycosyltransferase domain-containing protein [Coxiellaceae bacterium]